MAAAGAALTVPGNAAAADHVTTTGIFVGSFRTRFTGWGTRTAAFRRSEPACFAEESG
jgi:hypothetical protein